MHYASRGAMTAASAATMVGAAKAQTQDDAKYIARYSGTINLCSLVVALAGGVLWIVAQLRQRKSLLVPALLLIVYAVFFFVNV
jgi:hypothetical protein